MVWPWRLGEADLETSLTFDLTPVGEGTRLALTHAGLEDPVIAGPLQSGWLGKLAALTEILMPE